MDNTVTSSALWRDEGCNEKDWERVCKNSAQKCTRRNARGSGSAAGAEETERPRAQDGSRWDGSRWLSRLRRCSATCLLASASAERGCKRSHLNLISHVLSDMRMTQSMAKAPKTWTDDTLHAHAAPNGRGRSGDPPAPPRRTLCCGMSTPYAVPFARVHTHTYDLAHIHPKAPNR